MGTDRKPAEVTCSCGNGTILIERDADDGAYSKFREEYGSVLRECSACGGSTPQEEDQEEINARVAEFMERNTKEAK